MDLSSKDDMRKNGFLLGNRGVFFLLLFLFGSSIRGEEFQELEEENGDPWIEYFRVNHKFKIPKYHFRNFFKNGERHILPEPGVKSFPLNPAQEPRIQPLRLGLLGTFTAGTGLVLKNYYEQIWWNGKPEKFHFNNDLTALRFSDKFGHAYVALLINELYSPLFRWAGMSPGNARWGGVTTSILHQVAFVEYQDGFAEWGFSLSDVAADLVGAFYPLLQDRSSLLQHFDWKWSYHPSLHSWEDYLHWNTLLNDLYDNAFHMDYNGMTFWITGDLHASLPNSLKTFWPGFLNFAMGYSTEEMDINKGGTGFTEIFLSLDYDLKKLPGEGKVWKGVKSVLNIIHPPAPAIRITPDARFYVLYF